MVSPLELWLADNGRDGGSHGSLAEVERLDIVAPAQILCVTGSTVAPFSRMMGRSAYFRATAEFCSATRIERPSLAIELAERPENVLGDERRQSHGWLVENKKARPRHQRPANRRHLLLAARGQAGKCTTPFLQPGKTCVDLLDIFGDLSARAAAAKPTGDQASSTVRLRKQWRPSSTCPSLPSAPERPAETAPLPSLRRQMS